MIAWATQLAFGRSWVQLAKEEGGGRESVVSNCSKYSVGAGGFWMSGNIFALVAVCTFSQYFAPFGCLKGPFFRCIVNVFELL